MKQMHLWVSGFVQGVGYRAYTRHHAQKLGVVGWVKNLPDRRVEAVIQGEEKVLKKMIALCERGPYFSQVKDVVVEWEAITQQFPDFVIIRE